MTSSVDYNAFEAWWERVYAGPEVSQAEKDAADWAWEAATLAERERCAKVCGDLHSHYGVHDYHGLLLEASRAIRNP